MKFKIILLLAFLGFLSPMQLQATEYATTFQFTIQGSQLIHKSLELIGIAALFFYIAYYIVLRFKLDTDIITWLLIPINITIMFLLISIGLYFFQKSTMPAENPVEYEFQKLT